MANIENLRKQAKALVRLHRAGSHHLACVARDSLPAFAGLSDSEVLAAEFRLADAQALLAAQHGCESWSALKRRVEAEEDGPRPAVTDWPGIALPVLYVAGVRRSVRYYADVLGFDVLQVSGEPPFYAEVRRGGAQLALRFVHAPAIDPNARASETMLLQAIIRIADAKALYLEFLAAGAVVDTPLQRDPFGPHGFVVVDPDGNLLGFFEPGPGAVLRHH